MDDSKVFAAMAAGSGQPDSLDRYSISVRDAARVASTLIAERETELATENATLRSIIRRIYGLPDHIAAAGLNPDQIEIVRALLPPLAPDN